MGVAEEDDEETVLWHRTVETLLAQGATPTEAFDGANLVLQAYRRKRQAEQAAPPVAVPPDDGRGSGTRRRPR